MPITDSKYYLFIKRVLSLFFIGGGVFLLLEMPFKSNLQEVLWTFIMSGLLTVVIWLGNAYIVDLIKISWLEKPLLRLVISIPLTIVYTILAAALVQMVVAYLCCGQTPLESYNFISPIYFYNIVLITLLISTFLHGMSFFAQWKESLLEAERLKQAHLNSRFESLKNQVNPHFLFNSFNVLSKLVYKDQDLAANFIKQLSRTYRYVLDTKDEEVVTLSTELEALSSYIFLLKIRFGESLIINQSVSSDATQYIAPLTLQMLVENAIKHNIVSSDRPLTIKIQEVEDHYISVWNNLQPKGQVVESVGIGLPNIQERYQYISDRQVEIVEMEKAFEVRIPLITIKS